MADDQSRDDKTEQPTEKRISDAVEKGRVPHSKEAGILATFLATLVFAELVLPSATVALRARLTSMLDQVGDIQLASATDATSVMAVAAIGIAATIGPLFLVLAIAGLAANMAQNAPRIVTDRITPSWERISPLAGFKRIFGREGLAEFAIALLKCLLVGVVATIQLNVDRERIEASMKTDPSELPELILAVSVRLLGVVAVATLLIVAIDLVRARLAWRSGLKMSRQDIKDEHKQIEGDPIVKARLRSLARDRSRRRMLEKVPNATVVIANPTHFAVALRYVQAEGGAPLVLAKGRELIALKIREIAEANGIPVIEDVALARSLFKHTEVDQMIPSQFYRAVAEIIYHVQVARAGGGVYEPRRVP